MRTTSVRSNDLRRAIRNARGICAVWWWWYGGYVLQWALLLWGRIGCWQCYRGLRHPFQRAEGEMFHAFVSIVVLSSTSSLLIIIIPTKIKKSRFPLAFSHKKCEIQELHGIIARESMPTSSSFIHKTNNGSLYSPLKDTILPWTCPQECTLFSIISIFWRPLPLTIPERSFYRIIFSFGGYDRRPNGPLAGLH